MVDLRKSQALMTAMSLGWIFPICLGIGAGTGWVLDRIFGTPPVFLIVFFLLGVVAAFREVVKVVQALGEPDDENGGKGRR